MTTSTKLLAFAAGLLLVLAIGFGIGRAVGPIGADDAPAHHPTTTTTVTTSADAGDHDH